MEVNFATDGFEDLLEVDEVQRPVVLEGMQQARTYLQSGFLLAAEDACLVTIGRIPDYLPIQMVLAEVYAQQGHVERAIEKYECLIDLYRARDRKLQAIEVLKRSLRLRPPDAEKREKLISWMLEEGLVDQALREMESIARSHLEQGEADLGLGLYDRMVETAPDAAWVHMEFGKVLEGLGRRSEAVTHYVRSWELAPREPESCWRVIKFKLQEGSWEGLEVALEALTEVIQPGSEEASAAVEGIRSVLDTSPSRTAAHLCLGTILTRAGDTREAEEHLQKALSGDEKVPEGVRLTARLRLAQALLDGGQFDGVAAVLADDFEAVRGGLACGDVPLEKAQSYLRMLRVAYERKQDARGQLWVLEEMKALTPDQISLRRELAVLKFDLGQSDAGMSELLDLAAEHRRQGDLEEVLAVLLECKGRAPGDLEVRKGLCEALLGLDRVEDASKELEWLAESYQSTGNLAEAATSLRRLLEIAPTLDQLRMLAVRERILELDPGDSACRGLLGEAYLWMGLSRKGLACATEAARRSLEAGDSQVSRGALQLVVKIDPWNLWALQELGEMLYNAREHGECLRVFRRLRLLNPDNELAAKRIAEIEG